MKKNILRNIQLDDNEKLYKEFRKVRGKSNYYEMLLTTRRFIVYSHGIFLDRGRKTKMRKMIEIDIKSIRKLEYGIEKPRKSFLAILIGIVLLIASLALGYAVYMGIIKVPRAFPFQPFSKYIILGLLGIIGLLIMFTTNKTLYLTVVSGLQDKPPTLKLEFMVNNYNELAIRYLASKIHP